LYGLFWCKIGIGLLLYVILCICIYALNVSGVILDLLGAPVMAHFGMLRSILAHILNFWILFVCSCMAFILLVIDAKLSAYVAALSWILEVRNRYPIWSLCNHYNSGSRNSINRYGLSVSPCIVPL
jgi:hypothetical protein